MRNDFNNVEFGWYIPTRGDGRYVGVKTERESTPEYMIEVAKAAEAAGFTFSLIPTGGDCIDSWIVGSLIAAHTKVLRPLVALRPGLIAPVLAARLAASLDVVSGGRALINIVTGGSPHELTETGDPLADNHDERYERTREFLQIVRSVWTESTKGLSVSEFTTSRKESGRGEKVHFDGKYLQTQRGSELSGSGSETASDSIFRG